MIMSTTEITLQNGVIAEVTVCRNEIELVGVPIPVPGSGGGADIPNGSQTGEVPVWDEIGTEWLPASLQAQYVAGLAAVATTGSYNDLSGTPAIPAALADLDTTVTGAELNADHVKLAGVEDGATADQTGAEIKTAYEAEANTNAFTDAEKNKLAGLESSKFLGTYISLSALEAAHPAPAEGSYGHVDTGAGNEVAVYIWDSNDNAYFEQAAASSAETAASIKAKYESNPDTNAFTDSEKSDLAANTTARHASVTLVGEDYLSLAGQQITAGLVDVTQHITGVVPDANLPDYADVLEYADFASFPGTGISGKIYIALDTRVLYRWNGTAYEELSESSVSWGGITGTLSDQADLQAALDSKQDTLTFDAVPTDASTNPVESNGVYDAVQAVQSNLDTHEADLTNPHQVTAAQAGADPAGSAAAVQDNLDTHISAGTHQAGNITLADMEEYFPDNDAESALQYMAGLMYELFDDIALYPLSVTRSVVKYTWTKSVSNALGGDIVIVINKTVYNLPSPQVIDLTSYAGTQASPKDVHVYFDAPGGVPRLTASNNSPEAAEIHHVDVAIHLASEVQETAVRMRSEMVQSISIHEYLRNDWHLKYRKQTEYISGLDFVATATTLSIGTGTVAKIHSKLDSTAVSVAGGFFKILADGTVSDKTDFSFTQYSDGGTIGTNKYYWVTFGISTNDTTVLVAVVQKEPVSEFNSAAAAFEAGRLKAPLFPGDDVLDKTFVPVCFVVVYSGDNQLQEDTLYPGKYAVDIRGKTLAGGSIGGGGLSSVTTDGVTTHGTGVPADPVTAEPKTDSESISATGSYVVDFSTERVNIVNTTGDITLTISTSNRSADFERTHYTYFRHATGTLTLVFPATGKVWGGESLVTSIADGEELTVGVSAIEDSEAGCTWTTATRDTIA